MDCLKEYQIWTSDPYFDEATRAELKKISEDEKEIKERFGQRLQFGTGGLRAELGAGTNRMNRYTVALATEGLARYVESLGEEAKARGIAISHDSRNGSVEFAAVTAGVLAAHGIKAYVTDRLRPTPELSFAVRHFHCVGGVMVTASHNPAKYNGYKAYGEDGGQMPPEAADVVLREMDQIQDFRSLKILSEEEAKAQGLWVSFGEELDEKYNDMLMGLRINPEMIQKHSDLKIVYTPLHGAGNLPVQKALKTAGFKEVYVVPEQEAPNGDFPTVTYPNPEERAALEMGIELADKKGADLVLATDPDSDRAGLVVRRKDGSWQVLNGNQIGCLLMEYILSAKAQRGLLPEQSFCATTIVSTRLAKRICQAYDVTLFEVLTGFKFIGELIDRYDDHGPMHFQFGFEESYGYLTGTDVRDKDAVVSCLLIAEMAATAREEGQTLADRLDGLFERYGYAAEQTISMTIEGLDGIAKIKGAMAKLREEDTLKVTASPVKARRDYLNSLRQDREQGTSSRLELPVSDVLLYELQGDDWCCIRPSGTEPKLKVYFAAYDDSQAKAKARLEQMRDEVKAQIQELLA